MTRRYNAHTSAAQIALHSASNYGGAQFYIGCAQVNVANGGSGTPGPLVSIPGVYTGVSILGMELVLCLLTVFSSTNPVFWSTSTVPQPTSLGIKLVSAHSCNWTLCITFNVIVYSWTCCLARVNICSEGYNNNPMYYCQFARDFTFTSHDKQNNKQVHDTLKSIWSVPDANCGFYEARGNRVL